MAEPPTTDKQDSLEDSLSSEEWTIIYKKESKSKDVEEEKTDSEKFSKPKDTPISEDACKIEESNKCDVEHIEEGEEVGEKDMESDDVSILSDESELEHIAFEEGRIERIEWQVERKSTQSKILDPKIPSDGSITSNTLITCSVIALILGVTIAGQLLKFQGDKSTSYTGNIGIEDKLKELSGIEEKLKELNDVKNALEQIQISMPEMKKFKDQLIYQKNEKNKPNYSVDDKKLEKLDLKKLLDFNSNDDRLAALGMTYQNFCLTLKRINSSDSVIENEFCTTPKVLSNMITFKKNLKEAFQQTQDITSPEKRILIDVERKLDSVSDTLLSELLLMFSRFSIKVQERLNKFEYKLNKRLCSMSNTGRTEDKFFNILLDNDFFIKNCNITSDSDAIVLDSTLNESYKKKIQASKKRNYEELKKSVYKNDYKNSKDHKKTEDSKEYHSFEKEYNEEMNIEKSKGEVKNDSWKNNKYENLEHKYNKFDKNIKNEHNKKIKEEREFVATFENKIKEHDHDRKFEYNQRDNDYDRKSENSNKREQEYDNTFERYKKNNQFHKKFENKKKYESNHQFEVKKDHDFDRKFEHHKKESDFGRKFDHINKKEPDIDHKFENKRNLDYDDDDSKFIILENNADEFVTSSEFKSKYKKEKAYPQKPDSFKQSQYTKYHGNERKDKKDKYQSSGDWQMQRGKAREKLRNSDWYFVRADSRKKARIVEDIDDTKAEEEIPWSPPHPHRKPKHHHQQADNYNNNNSHNSHSQSPKDNLRKRFLRTFRRSWDFLNSKFKKYF